MLPSACWKHSTLVYFGQQRAEERHVGTRVDVATKKIHNSLRPVWRQIRTSIIHNSKFSFGTRVSSLVSGTDIRPVDKVLRSLLTPFEVLVSYAHVALNDIDLMNF